jgi:hypothetical protein
MKSNDSDVKPQVKRNRRNEAFVAVLTDENRASIIQNLTDPAWWDDYGHVPLKLVLSKRDSDLDEVLLHAAIQAPAWVRLMPPERKTIEEARGSGSKGHTFANVDDEIEFVTGIEKGAQQGMVSLDNIKSFTDSTRGITVTKQTLLTILKRHGFRRVHAAPQLARRRAAAKLHRRRHNLQDSKINAEIIAESLVAMQIESKRERESMIKKEIAGRPRVGTRAELIDFWRQGKCRDIYVKSEEALISSAIFRLIGLRNDWRLVQARYALEENRPLHDLIADDAHAQRALNWMRIQATDAEAARRADPALSALHERGWLDKVPIFFKALVIADNNRQDFAGIAKHMGCSEDEARALSQICFPGCTNPEVLGFFDHDVASATQPFPVAEKPVVGLSAALMRCAVIVRHESWAFEFLTALQRGSVSQDLFKNIIDALRTEIMFHTLFGSLRPLPIQNRSRQCSTSATKESKPEPETTEQAVPPPTPEDAQVEPDPDSPFTPTGIQELIDSTAHELIGV